jgi:WD40 repeat protein
VFSPLSKASLDHVTSISTATWLPEWKSKKLNIQGIAVDGSQHVYVATNGGELHVLGAADGAHLRTIGTAIAAKRRSYSLETADCVDVSPQGPAVWADDDFQIHISDETRQSIARTQRPADFRCTAIAFDPAGDKIAIGGTRGQVAVWKIRTAD